MTLLVLLGAALLTAGLLASGPIVHFVFPQVSASHAHEVQFLVCVMVCLLVLSMVSGGFFGVLNGLQRSDYENYAALANLVVGAMVTVAALMVRGTLYSLMLGAVAGALANVVVQAVGVHRLVPGLRPTLVRMSTGVARGYVQLSAMILVAQVGNIIDFQFDKVVLSRYVGTSAAGEYHIGTSLAIQARMLVVLPLGILLAGLTEMRQVDKARADRLYDQAARGTMALSALVFAAIIALAGPFVRIWLGGGYPHVALAAEMMSVAFFIGLLVAPLYFYCLAHEWHGLIAISALANTVVNCSVSYFLTLRIGFNGALYGSLAGNVAGTLAVWLLVRHRSRDHDWMRPGLLAAACVAPTLLVALLVKLPQRTLDPFAFLGIAALFVAVAALVLVKARVLPMSLVTSLFARRR